MDLTRKYCIFSSSGTSASRVHCRYLVWELLPSAYAWQSKGQLSAAEGHLFYDKEFIDYIHYKYLVKHFFFMIFFFTEQVIFLGIMWESASVSSVIGCDQKYSEINQSTDVSDSDHIREISKILNMWGDMLVWSKFISMAYSLYGGGKDRHAWKSPAVFAEHSNVGGRQS